MTTGARSTRNANADLAGDPARLHRRADRVPPRIVHRTSPAGGAFPRLFLAGPDLPGADPAGCYPGDPVRLLCEAPANTHRPAARCARAPVRAGRACRIPPGRGDRLRRAQVHQGAHGGAALGGLRLADRRRRDPARRGQTAPAPTLPRRDGLSDPSRVHHRALPGDGHDPGGVALGRHHRRSAAVGYRQALGHGVLLLPRHADHGRGLRLRPLQELRGIELRRREKHRAGVRRVVRRRRRGGALSAGLRRAATALRRSAGGASSSAAWGSAPSPCSAEAVREVASMPPAPWRARSGWNRAWRDRATI